MAATAGTAAYLEEHGVPVLTRVGKVADGSSGVNATDLIASGDVHLVINTPSGRSARNDGQAIRTAATVHKVSCLTTMSAAVAAVKGIADTRAQGWNVYSLQELHG